MQFIRQFFALRQLHDLLARDGFGKHRRHEVNEDQNGLREPVMYGLINAVQLHLERRAAGAFQVGAVLFSNQTGPLGQTETAEKLLQKWKES